MQYPQVYIVMCQDKGRNKWVECVFDNEESAFLYCKANADDQNVEYWFIERRVWKRGDDRI